MALIHLKIVTPEGKYYDDGAQRVMVRTTGGDVAYDLPLTKQGKDYICGDGSAALELKTTSGDITLLDAMQE